MKAIIITIGDEILIGQTVDTNSAWIGAELSKSGFDVHRIVSIHDKREDILNTLGELAGKYDVVLITGGLGPTSDDITKQTLCEYFNTKLVTNREVLKMIEELLQRRNFPMNENNRLQAMVPESCRILTNARGTAPGMWFEKENTIFISMPGVPNEMKYIMTEHVLPELNNRFKSQIIIHSNIMTYGTFEAHLAEMLESFEKELPSELKLAYLPSYGVIKLRITAMGSDKQHLTSILDQHKQKLYTIIPEFIYAENEDSLELVVGRLLIQQNGTVSTAESCTGGEIASMITSVPGSSQYFKGSVVAYSNTVKSEVLHVDKSIIEKYGAVSEQVVKEMAIGAAKLFKTDYSVAVSGIAGPDGDTPGKPLGTAWIAVSHMNELKTQKVVYGNDRLTNIKRFSIAALNLLRLQIIRQKPAFANTDQKK